MQKLNYELVTVVIGYLAYVYILPFAYVGSLKILYGSKHVDLPPKLLDVSHPLSPGYVQ